jgi:NAD-dependent dihydropyrimidine dehydrogenase PreA subunit
VCAWQEWTYKFFDLELRKENFAMAHVITDTCTRDNKCIDSCPSEAIHPLKDDPAWETVTQLYINPEECMDCGGCIPECPTNSIFAVEDLPADKQSAIEANANYFKK